MTIPAERDTIADTPSMTRPRIPSSGTWQQSIPSTHHFSGPLPENAYGPIPLMDVVCVLSSGDVDDHILGEQGHLGDAAIGVQQHLH